MTEKYFDGCTDFSMRVLTREEIDELSGETPSNTPMPTQDISMGLHATTFQNIENINS